MPSTDVSNFQSCELCGIGEDQSLGPLVKNEKITVHVACMVYTTGVWVRSASGQPIFLPRSDVDSTVLFNYDCVPRTFGFGDAVKNAQLCHKCNKPDATLRCCRVGCNKSFHIPCAIAAKGYSFIFEAKMVYYADEELHGATVPGVLRSGRFLLCRHHADWDRNPIWSCLQSYLSTKPAFVNTISVDVDTLPENLQIAVSKASQMSIFNPVTNQRACEYCSTDVVVTFKTLSYSFSLQICLINENILM